MTIRGCVSVLFSEPKIPQSTRTCPRPTNGQVFQCSSASRKFLNNKSFPCRHASSVCFSALQRAENSLMSGGSISTAHAQPFQCSSASRKFLNRSVQSTKRRSVGCFSALQRAENSLIPTLAPASIHISDRDDHASSFLSLPGASP